MDHLYSSARPSRSGFEMGRDRINWGGGLLARDISVGRSVCLVFGHLLDTFRC